ncbi:CRISPR-associated endonuclease Cas6 [Flectobacillus roseus]|uniref:CRISPR-associated endonuclease Cas6 n=1 Tax=Flectobacillus roseus TaxID=502259 RepID=A0ABT6Y747_9BACT|nr:CRISPR-associated endonuclease Cas6 [Flectobacillus roseus]MDI9858943.1 CRISPR-associated endonuclease Cas6 [Flectobacillus roseus]
MTTKLFTFSNFPMRNSEIKFFRTLVNDMLNWQNRLFHHLNHEGEELMGYPRIQYRLFKGKASLFGINEGGDAISNFVAENMYEFPEEMQLVSLKSEELDVKISEDKYFYKLHYYVPFSETEYLKWNSVEGLVQRLLIIEEKIRSDIHIFLRDMNMEEFTNDVWVKIESFEDKGNTLLPKQLDEEQTGAFNISFSSNIIVPSDIAIGKGVLYNYGVLSRIIV